MNRRKAYKAVVMLNIQRMQAHCELCFSCSTQNNRGALEKCPSEVILKVEYYTEGRTNIYLRRQILSCWMVLRKRHVSCLFDSVFLTVIL